MEDCLDDQLIEEEKQEHLAAIEDVKNGNFVYLADLPD